MYANEEFGTTRGVNRYPVFVVSASLVTRRQ